jgi:hypothetical protein
MINLDNGIKREGGQVEEGLRPTYCAFGGEMKFESRPVLRSQSNACGIMHSCTSNPRDGEVFAVQGFATFCGFLGLLQLDSSYNNQARYSNVAEER